MNQIFKLLSDCKQKGITIAIDETGRNIKAQGDLKKLTDSDKDFIKNHKTQILEFLIKFKQSDYAPIPVVEKNSFYPLSSSQKRLWVVSQHNAARIAYNVPLAFSFHGDLNYESLTAAFNTLIKRHESLRTTFKESEGDVFQIVHSQENAKFNLNFIDLQNEGSIESKLAESIHNDFEENFDLSSGPLMKVHLYQLTNDKWVCTWVMHHIISDGWSMQVLIKELLVLYNACNSGSEIPMTPLPIHYKDYTYWQQKRLKGPALNLHKSYWLQQFEGELPVLQFPTSYTRPTIKTYNGGCHTQKISTITSDQIRQLGKDNGSTLFMVLLAAVNVLLYRYTGQNDIIVGSPVAGREHPDLNNQVGFYVNTLALRTRFDGTDSFIKLLQTVRHNTLEAYEHQDYPLDELVKALPRQKDPGRDPLFDVWVVLHNNSETSFTSIRLDNLMVKEYPNAENKTSRRDLTFSFIETDEGVTLELGFNTDLYALGMIEQLASHYEQLLKAIVREPLGPIQSLEYLHKSEIRELTIDYNSRIDDNSTGNGLFIERFEKLAKDNPDAIALTHKGSSFTYQELNENANQLANYLIETYQLQTNQTIGILLGRNVWMVVAILGILKCRCTYLPIDTDLPKDRIQHLLQDSQSKMLIDEQEITKFNTKKDQYCQLNPDLTTRGTDLVYIIYTSGSTGYPKGVMINHIALMDYVDGILAKTCISECQSFGLVSTIAADLGNTVIYTALATGGSLNIYAKEELMNPKMMSTMEVDCLKIVPSHWKVLQHGNSYPTPRKCLIFGGEKLTEDIINLLKSSDELPEVYNHYGPTETTIGKLINKINIMDPDLPISLGKPIGDNQVYILDKQQKIVPKGVIGEICIAGKGISTGYFGKPALTAEKFPPNPFNNTGLMYKTGDLGRMLPNLTIEFIGRNDNQLKVRGYRIELEEIEHALLQHQNIISAVVTSIFSENEHRLIAYFSSSRELSMEECKVFLRNRIPDYMIPMYYIQLDKMPITLNGKVDRNALVMPTSISELTQKEHIPPENNTQVSLTSIWSDALGVDREKISIRDNFFDLGGHSLNAIKVVFKINEQFGTDLDLSILFDESTIEALSSEIENILWLQETKSESSLNRTVI